MSEFANSNDPRVRRSYAHAMLHKLSRGEVELEEVETAVSRADKTRKGQASDFAARLLAADREGRFRNRPTADCEIEIFTAMTGPDGKTEPVVIAAGSGEDFDRAWEEGEEFAASDRAQASDASPELLRANYALMRMAETSGLLPRVLFIRGAQMAQGVSIE
jgi:hypothetical protein